MMLVTHSRSRRAELVRVVMQTVRDIFICQHAIHVRPGLLSFASRRVIYYSIVLLYFFDDLHYQDYDALCRQRIGRERSQRPDLLCQDAA